MKFGTSGLRGLVSDMPDAVCERYTRAFLTHLERSGRTIETVLIGCDLRPSSPRIAAACARAALTCGADVLDCGALPTPALALEALNREAAAVMVTGSHIPFDRNGLKFYRPDGEIDKADESRILAALDAPSTRSREGSLQSDDGVGARYVDRACAAVPAGALIGLRIGVRQHSAVGRDLIVAALTRLGAEVVALDRSDTFVPIDTEAIDEVDARRARNWSIEHGLDALVTTDGDGDRPLIADETGTFLRGDALGTLTARALGADAVATPVTSSTGLERSGWFAITRRTRIGSPFVIEAMRALSGEGFRRVVGYEANGGFLVGSPLDGADVALAPLPTRDALLPIVTVLSRAVQEGRPLSALAGALPARATASGRLRDVALERCALLLNALVEAQPMRERLSSAITGSDIEHIDRTDGVRLIMGNGEIVHYRASGNAPELRCYAEAETIERADRLVAQGLAALDGAIASMERV